MGQPSTVPAVLLLALLGALAAEPVRRRLATRSYRYADEVDLPPRPTWWVTPATAVLLPLAVPASVADAGWRAGVVAGAMTLLLATLTVIDLDVHRLPDLLTLPAMPLLALGLTWASTGVPDGDLRLGWAWWCGGIALAVFGLLHLAGRRRSGLGLGDVKLAVLLGGWLGWHSPSTALVGLYAAFILGGLWSAGLLVLRRASGTTAIAFGPFLAAGALVAMALTSGST